jgi:hypothetical protein
LHASVSSSTPPAKHWGSTPDRQSNLIEAFSGAPRPLRRAASPDAFEPPSSKAGQRGPVAEMDALSPINYNDGVRIKTKPVEE